MGKHLFVDERPPAVRVASLGDLGGAIGASLLVAASVDAAGRLALPARDRVDDHGEQQDAAGDHELDRRRERKQVHSVRDRADDEGADQGGPDRAPAAEEAGAGDHRARRSRAAAVRCRRELWFTASSREAAMMPPIAAIVPEIAKTDHPDPFDPDPGPPRCLDVAADREDVTTEAGLLGDVFHADHEADQDQQRQRHAAVRVEDRDDDDRRGSDEAEPDGESRACPRFRGWRPAAAGAPSDHYGRRTRAITIAAMIQPTASE